ncbi:MAG: hypothetical protein IJ728_00075 [Selenomonadaceae bacterium]|nr:hypothetical protein [Selenomonadaceae bacterium]
MDNLSNNQSLKIFSNEAFGQFRTAGTADNPLFCLADVCKILSIGNPSDVKKRLDDGVVSIESIVDSLGRKHKPCIFRKVILIITAHSYLSP